MSAYIVGHAHIDALLTFATSKRYGRGVVYTANETLIEINCDNASEIGRILLTENERSVRHCYPNDAAGDLPGAIGEDSANYEFIPFDERPTPVSVLKGCDCFDYQACETGDYGSSIACAIIEAIRKRVKMSQAEFSRAYRISKRALQEWEQGGRQPDSAARAYLLVIAKEPTIVRRALAGE